MVYNFFMKIKGGYVYGRIRRKTSKTRTRKNTKRTRRTRI